MAIAEKVRALPPQAGADPAWSLRAAMSRLWADHVIWTRGYIVVATGRRSVAEFLTLLAALVVRIVAVPLGAIISILGFADAAAVRLMRNQHDLGRAIVPFYGGGAAGKFRRLMKRHITIAVKMVSAARAGHQRRFDKLDRNWTENAEQIAGLLAAANPNWRKSDVFDLLGQHLALTKREVDARLNHQWDQDVEAYDLIFTEILTLSDVLVDGITKQFPERLPANQTPASVVSLRRAMRRLWSDHVIWTRQYIVAALDGKPDADAAALRLLKNQDDIGAAVGSFYGEAAGTRLTELLKQHIMIAVDIISAAKGRADAKFKSANEEWDRNAADIATFLSAANPNWSRDDLLDLLMQHLNLTREEVTAHLKRKRKADIEAFDLILTEILTVSDTLSDGIVRQFPGRF